MGSGGAKETNRMLEEQRQRTNELGGIAGGRSQEQYDQVSGLPGEILGEYRTMLGNLDSGGGARGVGYTPAQFESEALPFFLEMMRTGGYTDEDKSNILSYATGPLTGIFEGLARRMDTLSSGAGLPSYGGSTRRLALDRAYGASETAKGVAGDLAERVLANRFRGGEGTAGIEQQKRNFEASERARALSAARSGSAANSENWRRRMSILSAMGDYRPGNDLEYFDRAMGAAGQGAGIAGSRRDETPLWQRSLAGILPSAAGAAAAAFMPGGGGGGRGRSFVNRKVGEGYYE